MTTIAGNIGRASVPPPSPGASELAGAEAGDCRTIRVFVLDDHALVRAAVLDHLAEEDDLEVVGACGSAAEALRLIPALRPDVAVLDYHLAGGDGDGVSVCERVRSLDAVVKVLLLTASDDPELADAAMRAGASGYLVKKIRGLQLAEAVRNVAAGDLVFGP